VDITLRHHDLMRALRGPGEPRRARADRAAAAMLRKQNVALHVIRGKCIS
jgi:hypothetical protein